MNNNLCSVETLKQFINQLTSNNELSVDFNSPIVKIEELSAGNINQVFRVVLENKFSFIVKYAPPFAYRYQDINIANQRNAFEANITKIFSQYNKETYPQIYYYSPELHLTLMQDLKDCIIMRDALLQGDIFTNFAEKVVEAICCYPGNIPKEKLSPGTTFTYQQGVPELQTITRDFVFQCPFGLKYPEGVVCLTANLDWVEKNIFQNKPLQKTRRTLEDAYYNKQEALIHGDLHTGSIMLNADQVYFIDPEFARIGPISFDIGMLIANLIMSTLAAEYHLKNNQVKKAKFQAWLMQCMEFIYKVSITRLVTQYEFNEVVLSQEIMGYCAIEIVRRTIGAAQIQDFLSIDNMQHRAEIERSALTIAVQQLTIEMTSITHTVELLKQMIGEKSESNIFN